MRLKSLILIAFVSLTVLPAFGQSIDSDSGQVPMSTLPSPWRFHAGDDPSWSSPTFDDSSWSLLVAGDHWSRQGYSGYSGVAWYRLSVTLPHHPGPLALNLPYVENSCEEFANGRLIGHIGSLPPHPAFYVQYNSLFPIPAEAISSGHPLQLAIRVWLDPVFADSNSGGLTIVPRLGNAAVLEEWRQLQIHDRFWRSAARVADVAINIFTALAGIGLRAQEVGSHSDQYATPPP